MGNRQLSREVLSRIPAALLIDLDGTLYTDAGPIAGAVAGIAALRRQGTPFRFVSNTTRRSRRGLLERLRGYGFTVQVEELITSVATGAAILRGLGVRRVAPFLARSAFEDLEGFDLAGGLAGASTSRPDAVLVGDLGPEWTPALLNEAFRCVLDGAALVALQKDRYWLGATGLELDAGPYVAALEYATGVTARVCGKPSPAFYHLALESMRVGLGGSVNPGASDPPTRRPAGLPAMIGDDLWADVDGAQRAGLQGWLVRTGKFRADVLDRSGVKPDRILDSIADLVEVAG